MDEKMVLAIIKSLPRTKIGEIDVIDFNALINVAVEPIPEVKEEVVEEIIEEIKEEEVIEDDSEKQVKLEKIAKLKKRLEELEAEV